MDLSVQLGSCEFALQGGELGELVYLHLVEQREQGHNKSEVDRTSAACPLQRLSCNEMQRCPALHFVSRLYVSPFQIMTRITSTSDRMPNIVRF